MNITFLSYYSGQNYRGAETYTHELANHLTELSCHVQVYQKGSPVPGAKYHTNYLSSLTSFPRFESKPDILIPTNGRFQAVLSKLWCLTNHKKMVISGQSGLGLDDRLNLYCFPDTFIGLSIHQCNWAKQINHHISISRIPNGVDLHRFNPQVKPLKINLPHPIILNVAALVPSKRQELLIQAIAKTSASLLLVGRGGDQAKLQDLGEKLLGNRFQILALSYDQMPQIYTACDLFSFPTVPWESFGLVLLEAMASGLPVVATNDPIRTEIVGPAGLFSDPTDISSFASVISQALQKNWQKIPRLQAENYSWTKIANQYYSLFSQLNS